MSKIYCGAGKKPKNSRFGNMKECAEKNQVRRYGVNKVDSRIIQSMSSKNKNPVTLHKIGIKAMGFAGKMNKYQRYLKSNKLTDKERKEYTKELKKATKEREFWSKKYNDLKNKQKAEAKKKTTPAKKKTAPAKKKTVKKVKRDAKGRFKKK